RTSMRFFFSSRRRHTRSKRDWSSDVCSSDLASGEPLLRDDLVEHLARVGIERARDLADLGVVEDRREAAGQLPGLEERRPVDVEIGRASCRERGEISVRAVGYDSQEDNSDMN